MQLSGWLPFERAVELIADILGIEVSKIVAQQHSEAAGAAYVQMQEEEVARLEREMPEAPPGGRENADQCRRSDTAPAVGAGVVPLLHGVWAEVRTLVVGEVSATQAEQGEPEIHARKLSYFSRKVTAQEFQRLALVEIQRRGIENAGAVAAVMDGADWEQNFIDFHCPRAVRILDFAHAVQHIHPIGEYLHGEHTSESQAWLQARVHRLKHEGPESLLDEFEELQRQHPDTQVIPGNLAYLKKRKAQLQYPQFQAQGWPIGSGIVESGNKLVVEARLKGAGMHWAEEHVNPMLALRNILCSGRWKEEWPKIEARLRKQTHQRRKSVHLTHHPPKPTTLVAQALQGYLDEPLPDPILEQAPRPPKTRKNPWRNFKHGKALFQRSSPPKI